MKTSSPRSSYFAKIGTAELLLSGLLVASGVVAVSACSSSPPAVQPGSIKAEMHTIQSEVTELFSYAWNPEAFADPENRSKIAGLLERLQSELHTLPGLSVGELRDPGYAVILARQRRGLEQATEYFAAGQSEIASVQLRALATDCVSCHSRSRAAASLIGLPPPPASPSLKNRFAAAEYLFATRQFPEASKALFEIASDRTTESAASPYPLTALQLWLLIEVRVLNRPAEAAAQLETFSTSLDAEPGMQQLLAAWKSDLLQLAREGSAPGQDPVDEAQALLNDCSASPDVVSQRRDLVKTLRATGLLHEVLLGQPKEAAAKQALLLLAQAYRRFPLPVYRLDWQLYDEELIRRYPGSEAAQAAFEDYRQAMVAELGPSSSWSEEQRQKLLELENAAFEDPLE